MFSQVLAICLGYKLKDVGVTTSRLSQVPGSRFASLLGQATRVSPRRDILQLVYNTPNADVSVAFPSKRVQICEIRNPEDNVRKRPLPINYDPLALAD